MVYITPYGIYRLATAYRAVEVWSLEPGRLLVILPDDVPFGLLDLPGSWEAPGGQIADVDTCRWSDPRPGYGRRLHPPAPLPPIRTVAMPEDPLDYAARRRAHDAAADALAARHPMFDRAQRDDSTYQWFGLECGSGWIPLLDAVASAIEDRCAATGDPLPYPTQVKEKFGALRIHLDGADEFAFAVTDAAEALSERVCETSGRPGLRGTVGGWHITLAPGLPLDPVGRGEFIPFCKPGDNGGRLADGTAGALAALAAARPELDTTGLPIGWVDLVDVLAGVLAQERRTWRGEEMLVTTGGRILAARRGVLDELELVVEDDDPTMIAAVEAFACHVARLTDPATGAMHSQG